MKSSHPSKATLIWSALILLALILSACAEAVTPAPTQDIAQIQTEAAKTVVADITQNAPLPTQAPPPTSTPAPPPTPTQVPAPTYPPGDPAIELGPPDGFDPFDSAINFAAMSNNCFVSEFTAGQFVMAAKGLQGIYCWTTSWAALQDFYLETSSVMPETCDSRDNFGLLVRSPDSTSGYLYGLNCAGQYSLRRMTSGSVTDLVPPTASPAILVGANQVNRLGIAAYGGNFLLFANGQYLATVSDYTYPEAGDIGYYVSAATSAPFVSRYNDLRVWVLEDAYYPSAAPAPVEPTVEPAPPASGAPFVTATTAVNIRSGPGTIYPIYGVAPIGASAQVQGISPDGAWYNISIPATYSPDGTAWVSAGFVTLTGTTPTELPVVQPPPPPAEVTTQPPAPSSASVQTTEPINLRSGPGNEYPSYGVVPANTPLQATGISSDGKWVSVVIPVSIAPDGVGWVNAAYLQPFDPSTLP